MPIISHWICIRQLPLSPLCLPGIWFPLSSFIIMSTDPSVLMSHILMSQLHPRLISLPSAPTLSTIRITTIAKIQLSARRLPTYLLGWDLDSHHHPLLPTQPQFWEPTLFISCCLPARLLSWELIFFISRCFPACPGFQELIFFISSWIPVWLWSCVSCRQPFITFPEQIICPWPFLHNKWLQMHKSNLDSKGKDTFSNKGKRAKLAVICDLYF